MDLTMPIYYHRQGLQPIPVNGKASLESWKEYQEKLSPEHVVREWFIKHKDAGLAILTGPVSNVIVLDLDGEEALDAVKKYYIPKTWWAKTRKGYHYYFKWKSEADFPTTITALNGMKGVDVRGRGGYVVAPPSYNIYSWIHGYAPWEVGLADLPDWLFSLLSHHKRLNQTTESNSDNSWVSKLLEGVCKGGRHSALLRLTGYYLSRMPRDVVVRLLTDWNQKNDPPLSEAELEATVNDVAKRYETGEYKSKFQEKIEEDEEPLLPVNVSYFLDSATPQIDWLVQNLIPKETSAIIGGMQGIGKSWGLLDLAVEVARGGGKWFDYLPVEGGRVLYIDEESSEHLLRYRLKKLVTGKQLRGTPLDLHFAVGQGFSFTNGKKLEKFKELLLQLKPTLIIMDSLICFHHLDENSAKDMRYLFKIVKKLIDQFNCTFIFADHEGKGNPKDKGFQASHRLRGSSAKGDATDTVISITKKEPHLIVEHTKARFYKPIPRFAASIDDISDGATIVRNIGFVGEQHER